MNKPCSLFHENCGKKAILLEGQEDGFVEDLKR
jgi:hypothetical protein